MYSNGYIGVKCT